MQKIAAILDSIILLRRVELIVVLLRDIVAKAYRFGRAADSLGLPTRL